MEQAFKQQPSNCKKVVFFGPESTGKTTLSKQLATHYNEPWVPEYARDYLQNKWDTIKQKCTYEDLVPIAKGQIRLENLLAQNANKMLFCDTNLLETKVYSEVYFNGKCPPIINKFALKHHYDLYFLTYIDTPWEPDDLRDKPTERLFMFNVFKNTLIQNKISFIELKGNQQERFNLAVNAINHQLIK